MSEPVKYTITVGDSTNVTATAYDVGSLNDQQIRQLEALVQSGDIDLELTTGIIKPKTSHGLVRVGALMGMSFDELMEIDGLSGEIRRGMTHEGVMAALNRFSSSDPEKMSLSELMACLIMMVYMSESERREALQTAKGKQLLIQIDQARIAWAQSREAAERMFVNSMLSAVGTICSSFCSFVCGVTSAGIQGRVASHQKKIHENKQIIQQKELADQMRTKVKTIAEQNATEIKDKQTQINENNAKIDARKNEIGEDAAKNDVQIKQLEHENILLNQQKQKLIEENKNLGFGENGEKLTESNLKVDYDAVGKLQDDPTYQQIKALKGEVQSDGTIKSKGSDIPWGKDGNGKNINVYKLQQENVELEAKIKELNPWASGLQQAGVLGHLVLGGFQIGAACAMKDADFLRAEAQLTDAYKAFSSAMVQNIDSSTQQALQQMEKLVSSLKEVFRAMYDIECSIARNI